jgi:hypothetical protein
VHPYATDSGERTTIPILLGALALGAAYLLGKLIAWLNWQNLWWLDLPGVWGFYVVFLWLFDRWVWRWDLLRTVGLVKVPDLNGKWKGIGVSSFKEEEKLKEYNVEVDFRQRWRSLCVFLDTETSRSQSVIAGFLISDKRNPLLSYEYQNDPRPHSAKTMRPHRGMTRLELVAPTILDGEYYTGSPDKQNYGSLRLEKVISKRPCHPQ